ncbi:MAG TPA: hypothetical protein VIC34_04875 [Croceibacterium sp.]|jgi:hypothetical protein
MPLKPYQWLLLAGSLLAFIQAAARLAHWEAPVQPLEAPSFLLCMAAILVGGRNLRSKFEDLGSSKAVALRDADYMRERTELQFWAVPAVGSIFSLLLVRTHLNPMFALAILAGLPLVILLVNRERGWTKT